MLERKWEKLGHFYGPDISQARKRFGGYIPFELTILFQPTQDEIAAVENDLIVLGNRILIIGDEDWRTPRLKTVCSYMPTSEAKSILKGKPENLYHGLLRFCWLQKQKAFTDFYTGSDVEFYINLDVFQKEDLNNRWLSLIKTVNDKLKYDYIRVYNKYSISELIDVTMPVIMLDRHAKFINKKVNNEQNIITLVKNCNFKGYYEEWGINSALYLALFNPPSSEQAQIDLFLSLLEMAIYRILIIDERIAESAFKIFDNFELFKVLAAMGIYLVTHIDLTGTPLPIGKSIGKNDNQAFCLTLKEDRLSVCYGAREENCFDFLIVHQGVLENPDIQKQFEEGFSEIFDPNDPKSSYEKLLDKIYQQIPFIVIDSGRGLPANIPDNAKFVSYSAIQDNLLRKCPNKYELLKNLLRLTRRKKT